MLNKNNDLDGFSQPTTKLAMVHIRDIGAQVGANVGDQNFRVCSMRNRTIMNI